MFKRSVDSPFLLVPVIVFLLLLQNSSCFLFNSAGKDAANTIGSKIESSSKSISTAMLVSTIALTKSIDNAQKRLKSVAKSAVSEVGYTIRQSSRDLVKISEKITESVDYGVYKMGAVMKEAINATQEISDKLFVTADKAVDKFGNEVRNIAKTVRDIAGDLKNSVDHSVNELGATLRHVADKIAEAAKQINFNVDSNHLIGVANVTGEALVKAVQELSQNWEIAVNTAHLQDAGQAAAAELSKALQNLRGYLEIHVGIDDNLRIGISYVSLAGGIAFSVLFIALVLSIKSCRTCVIRMCAQFQHCGGDQSHRHQYRNNFMSSEEPHYSERSKYSTRSNNFTDVPLKPMSNPGRTSDCGRSFTGEGFYDEVSGKKMRFNDDNRRIYDNCSRY